MNYYGGYGYGMMNGFGAFDVIWHVLSFILVLWLVVWAIRMIFGGGHRRHRRWMHMDSATVILDERFAKGEIDRAEYEERKKALLG